MKKTLLSIGTIGAVTAPIATVVACGPFGDSETPKEDLTWKTLRNYLYDDKHETAESWSKLLNYEYWPTIKKAMKYEYADIENYKNTGWTLRLYDVHFKAFEKNIALRGGVTYIDPRGNVFSEREQPKWDEVAVESHVFWYYGDEEEYRNAEDLNTIGSFQEFDLGSQKNKSISHRDKFWEDGKVHFPTKDFNLRNIRWHLNSDQKYADWVNYRYIRKFIYEEPQPEVVYSKPATPGKLDGEITYRIKNFDPSKITLVMDNKNSATDAVQSAYDPATEKITFTKVEGGMKKLVFSPKEPSQTINSATGDAITNGHDGWAWSWDIAKKNNIKPDHWLEFPYELK